MPKFSPVSALAELESTTPPAVESTPAEVKTKPKTYTNWEIFAKAKVVPLGITCHGYSTDKFRRRVDLGCHSRLLIQSKNIIQHIDADHGGGFVIKLRQTDGKPWGGWAALGDAGVEIHDLRCMVCDKDIPLQVRHIQTHLRPHRGDGKSAWDVNKLCLGFNLSYNSPLASGNDDESSFESTDFSDLE